MEHNPFSLKGKTIFITGASSGIGRATALECSRMGAALIINGRNEEHLRATFDSLEGNGHRMLPGDLSVRNACRLYPTPFRNLTEWCIVQA